MIIGRYIAKGINLIFRRTNLKKLNIYKTKLITTILSFCCICSIVFNMMPVITTSGAATNSRVPADIIEKLGIGWNLGNSLDCVNKKLGYTKDTEEIWGNKKATSKLFKAVKKAGFSSVRIPVTYYNHIDSKKKIDPEWLKRVSEVVDYAINENLYVVIDVHHDAGMDKQYSWIFADTDTYAQSSTDLTTLWAQIAEYFKNYDEHLIFQATNEIINVDGNWDWGQSYKDFRVVHDLDQHFINVVRGSGGNNATRYLMLTTWGASVDSCEIESLFYKPFEDAVKGRLIMSVHNYATKQDGINAVVASLSNYSKKYNIPVVIDESGTFDREDMNVRIAALSHWVYITRKEHMGYFWWDNGSDSALFSRVDYHVIHEDLIRAIKAGYAKKYRQGVYFNPFFR